jgi:hypothetical protein
VRNGGRYEEMQDLERLIEVSGKKPSIAQVLRNVLGLKSSKMKGHPEKHIFSEGKSNQRNGISYFENEQDHLIALKAALESKVGKMAIKNLMENESIFEIVLNISTSDLENLDINMIEFKNKERKVEKVSSLILVLGKVYEKKSRKAPPQLHLLTIYPTNKEITNIEVTCTRMLVEKIYFEKLADL